MKGIVKAVIQKVKRDGEPVTRGLVLTDLELKCLRDALLSVPPTVPVIDLLRKLDRFR